MSAPSRNAPCPCGSGKKHKHCCGAPRSAAARSCGACTACCDGWLRITIDGQPVYPGRPCPHSTGSSCRIYAERPVDPCRRFSCEWLSGGDLPEAFSPDRAGFIVLGSGWRGLKVRVLVSAGRDPDEHALEWFRSEAVRRGRPFIFQRGGEWRAFGPPEFQAEVTARVARGDRLW
jgi:hypothetical protein